MSGLAAWPVASTSATILWDTDQTATSTVNYGTTSAYGQTATAGSNIYHAVPLTNLTAGTTYHYQVVTSDSAGTTTSGDNTFTTTGTAPASSGPVISGVAVSNVTTTGVTITWTTDQPSSSQVSYGPSTAYGSQSLLVSTLATSHSVPLTGLQAAAAYDFEVMSTDSGGSTTSANYTFSTAAASGPSGSAQWQACTSASTTCTSANVGIGTTNPQNALSVNGIIQAKEVLVNSGWSDYVFDRGYPLQPLTNVAAYIQEHHHLEGVPSAGDVAAHGVTLGEMQATLLAKIEELTLHMIELDRENRQLKTRMDSMGSKQGAAPDKSAPNTGGKDDR